MAKKKEGMDRSELFRLVAQRTKGDLLSDIDAVKYCVDTGNLAFNYVCSGRFLKGGVPAGRAVEIQGESSTGKSLFGANILYGCQKLGGWPILLDCENASNAEFMNRASHVDLSTALRYTPMTLEKAFGTIYEMIRKIRDAEIEAKEERKPIIFIYDSIAASPCERELREVDLPLNYKPSDWKKIVGRQEQPGERAKICSKEFRKLTPMLEKEDATVIFLNQLRDNIGVMYGPKTVGAGGGKAMKFYPSLRLELATQKKIENTRLETFAGVNIRVKNIKNRAFRPFVTVEGIKLYFDTGIDPLSGLLSCLVQSERIAVKSPGNYYVLPDYLPEGVAEYKFKCTKAENRVPKELVLDCPKVIDGESREEVEAYLDSYGAGLEASQSSDFKEKGVKFDEEGNMIENDSFDMAEPEEPEVEEDEE